MVGSWSIYFFSASLAFFFWLSNGAFVILAFVCECVHHVCNDISAVKGWPIHVISYLVELI